MAGANRTWLNPSPSQLEEQLLIGRLIDILSHWHEDIPSNKLVNDFNVCASTCECNGFPFTLYNHFSGLPVYIPSFHHTVSPRLDSFTTCWLHAHDSVKCYTKDFLWVKKITSQPATKIHISLKLVWRNAIGKGYHSDFSSSNIKGRQNTIPAHSKSQHCTCFK